MKEGFFRIRNLNLASEIPQELVRPWFCLISRELKSSDEQAVMRLQIAIANLCQNSANNY